MRESLRGHGRTAAVALTLATALALASGSARAHIVYGTASLSLLTQQSDLVVRLRIVDPDAVIQFEDPVMREAVVVAEVLERLSGCCTEKQLRFVQHGHGVPKYTVGQEVVVFLQDIERSRELGATPIAEQIRWISTQEAGSVFLVDERTRSDLAASVRAYASVADLPAQQRPDAMRRITLDLLASPQPVLATSAVRDLVLAGDTPLVRAEDLPILEPLLTSEVTPIGVRIGLLVELERRGLVEGPPRWSQLLRTTSGRDRFAVVRAAATHPSAAVAKELQRLLADEDSQLVAAAAVSLGAAGGAAAVAPLAALLASDEWRVRMAAIRGLGRIATPEASRVLAQTATAHSDAVTRRRARAEVSLLERASRTRGELVREGER